MNRGWHGVRYSSAATVEWVTQPILPPGVLLRVYDRRQEHRAN